MPLFIPEDGGSMFMINFTILYRIYFDIPKRPLRVYQRSFIHSSMALQPFAGHWPFLQFRNLFYTVGRTPWTGDQPVARPLYTHRTTQTQNKHIQTSMPSVGFESTSPASETAKTVHASDRAATAIGIWNINTLYSVVFILTIVWMRCFKLCGDAGDDY
jgi:hypothetical protein